MLRWMRWHKPGSWQLFLLYTLATALVLYSLYQNTKYKQIMKLNFLSYQVPNISPSEAEFKPCVDNHVMLDIPRILLHDGRINPVSFMTGTVKDEWTKNIGWFIQELYSDIPHLGTVSFRFKLQSRHSNMRCWGVISLQKLTLIIHF